MADLPVAMVEELLGRYPFPALEWAGPPLGQVDGDALVDLARGSLLWGAVGDALGRPGEGRPAGRAIREYHPWHGYADGPIGTVTDDTQLTMLLGEHLVRHDGEFDPVAFARELAVAWGQIRGKGVTMSRVVPTLATALEHDAPWWGPALAEHTAGNGAAMRAAPLGLARALDPTPAHLLRLAVLSALPTHTHPVGVAGAVVVAAGVAWCLRQRLAGATRLDVSAFLAFVCDAIALLEPEPTRERKPGGDTIRLVERLRELPELLTWDTPGRVFAHTYSGAFALETIPAALYAFLRSPEAPREVILTAVNAGYDVDTIGSIAGNLAGAWRGAARLAEEAPTWWAELEFRDELLAQGERLAGLALRRGGDDGAPRAARGNPRMAALRAALRAVPEARSLHIRDEWSGLNPTAPWLAAYALERDPDDGFVGAALFAAGGSAKVARRFALPGAVTRPFLELLATVRPVAGEYTPRFTHTDDFPELEIHLETPAGGVRFHSTSQGRQHTPWAITHGGETFVVTSARPAEALAALRPYLRRETLDALIADLEREMDDAG